MILEVIYVNDSKDTFHTANFTIGDQFIIVNETKEVTIRIPYSNVKKIIVAE